VIRECSTRCIEQSAFGSSPSTVLARYHGEHRSAHVAGAGRQHDTARFEETDSRGKRSFACDEQVMKRSTGGRISCRWLRGVHRG
jgi:hypothetical protein